MNRVFIFDVDGTLTNSRCRMSGVFENFFTEECGLKIFTEEMFLKLPNSKTLFGRKTHRVCNPDIDSMEHW